MATPTNDAELVERFRNGDTGAYVQLMHRYERLARVVAMRYLHNHHAVEEAVQQAFVLAFEKLPTLKESGSFQSWLAKIVQREAMATVRTQYRFAAIPISVEPIAKDPEPEGDVRELAEAINSLPDHERIVVVLRYLDGHSTQDIASILERPIGTVTKQLSRAIARLQKTLNKTEVRK